MRVSRKQYDPQFYHDRSIEILDVVNPEEARAWFDHPCTQSLLLSLQGDMAGIVLCWINGVYADKSIDATAQENAKRIGQLQTIDEIIEHIENLSKVQIEGETYDDKTSRAYSPD